MLKHDFEKRVRYAETDKMGYLYYGNYPTYYEIGRAEMIRSLGLTYQQMEDDHNILMPVVSMQIRYVRPAHYDDLLTIRTTLRKLPDNFITFHMEIFNEKEELINGATVRLCFVDRTSGESIPAPPVLKDKLLPYFEAH